VSLLGVGVGARFEAVLPDGFRVEAHGSPDIVLRRDVANELFASTPTAVVRAIDRICIVSSDGVTEFCTTSLSWAVVSSGPTRFEAQVSGSVTAGASMTVGYFRAKAGAIRYFESSVSPPFDVLAGQTVSLTMTLVLASSHSPSVSGGLPSVSAVESRNLLSLLYNILRGQRPADTYLTLNNVLWRTAIGATLLGKPLSRTYSPGATSGRAEHGFDNFGIAGLLIKIHVNCTGQADCIVYTLSSELDVDPTDRARFTIEISVS
jgi:hypothetical protein